MSNSIPVLLPERCLCRQSGEGRKNLTTIYRITDASQSELLPAQFLRRASDEKVSEGREAMGGAQDKMTAVLPVHKGGLVMATAQEKC